MARYRAINGKNREFMYLDCWKILKEEPKFQLMISPSKSSPNDEEVALVILTKKGTKKDAKGYDSVGMSILSNNQQQSKRYVPQMVLHSVPSMVPLLELVVKWVLRKQKLP